MREPDDVRAWLTESGLKTEPFRVVCERYESRVAVRVIAHEDGQLPAGSENRRTVLDELLIPIQKVREVRSRAHVPSVIRVDLLTPVGRMDPDEIELPCRVVLRLIAGVEPEANVETLAEDAKLVAHVPTCARSRHRIEDALRLEVEQQVFDQDAAAIAGIRSVPVVAAICPMEQAREPGIGTRVARSAR